MGKLAYNIAQDFITSNYKNKVIALHGTLGAGKSFFAKNFINALTDQETQVLSPTFNLVYSYQTNLGEIFHFDLYRIKNTNELENIGFFEAINNNLTLIEWPKIAEKFLPKNHLAIIINCTDDSEAREVEILYL